MKSTLKISISLNLVLIGGLLYFLANQQRIESAGAARSLIETAPTAQAADIPTVAPLVREIPKPFRWSQLVCSNDYRIYIANLRAIGCPEPTIRDIVAGDAGHAFAFKRAALKLDGSGTGTWSRLHEVQLVADLLGEQPVITGNINLAKIDGGRAQPMSEPATEIAQARTETQAEQTKQPNPAFAHPANPVYPLAFRQADLAALGFGAAEKTAIDQVREQFVQDVGGTGQNPDDPAYLARWQTAQANADDMLRGALGSQAFMAFQFQQYYDWYQPQITAAETSGRRVALDPELFSQGK